MSLYVRVELSFYTHRKTLRLKSIIGNDAFWVPPRLWAYAAGNQPDGDFTDYTPEEISSLIGYSGDAQALLQALLKTGFMDANPLRIHDWHEYNGILDFFSKRAKKAAEVRWAKERSKEKKQTKAKQIRAEHSIAEPSIASSIPAAPVSSEHEAFIDGWIHNFKAFFGFDYSFEGGRDGKAVREILRNGILRIDLLEIAKKAWKRGSQTPKSFYCVQASSIHGFKTNLNHIRAELNGSKPVTPEQNQLQEKIEVKTL